jgi:hypothetical protein
MSVDLGSLDTSKKNLSILSNIASDIDTCPRSIQWLNFYFFNKKILNIFVIYFNTYRRSISWFFFLIIKISYMFFIRYLMMIEREERRLKHVLTLK